MAFFGRYHNKPFRNTVEFFFYFFLLGFVCLFAVFFFFFFISDGINCSIDFPYLIILTFLDSSSLLNKNVKHSDIFWGRIFINLSVCKTFKKKYKQEKLFFCRDIFFINFRYMNYSPVWTKLVHPTVFTINLEKNSWLVSNYELLPWYILITVF